MLSGWLKCPEARRASYVLTWFYELKGRGMTSVTEPYRRKRVIEKLGSLGHRERGESGKKFNEILGWKCGCFVLWLDAFITQPAWLVAKQTEFCTDSFAIQTDLVLTSVLLLLFSVPVICSSGGRC